MSVSYHPPASFPPQNSDEQEALLQWIERTPLVYGPWQDFKRGYKTLENTLVEGKAEIEVLGALLSRLDAEPFPAHRKLKAGTPQPLLAGSMWSLLAGNGVIYASTTKGFQVFEADSPLVPTPIPLPDTSQFHSGVLVGNHLVSSNGALFNLENPREPKFVTRGNLSGNEVRALGEQHVVSCGYWDGLQVYRLPENGQAFTSVGAIEGIFNHLFISGGRGVSTYHPTDNWRRVRMRWLDLSNPNNPILGAEIGDRDEQPLAFDGSILYAEKGNVLRVYDAQEKPRLLGSIQIPDLRGFKVHGNLGVAFTYRYEYGSGTSQNLVFIDLSQPHDPRKVGEIPCSYQPETIRIGNVLWIAANDGLHILDISNLSRAQFIGQKPSAATYAYLKRRGRRLLRMLAESVPSTYLALANELLRRNQSSEIDFSSQWIEADILVGAGPIWEQARHGRGPIKRRPEFWRRQRLERASAAWDTRLDLARELASRENLPWQTRVTMRRILAANKEPLPSLAAADLEAILWGDWPFAAVEAAREAEARVKELTPRGVAALIWNVNPRRRRSVLTELGFGDTPFSPAIGTHLATLLGRDVQTHTDNSQGSRSQNQSLQIGLTRRAREIALLLAARCDLSNPKFDASGAVAALPALLGAHEAPLRNLGLDLSRRVSPEQALELVSLLPRLTATIRESFIEALCLSATKGRFKDAADLAARVRHSNTDIRVAVWRLLAASKTSPKVTREVWTGILRGLSYSYDYNSRSYRWTTSSFLDIALSTPAALEVLARSGANTNEITRFGPRFWNQPAAPAHIFAAYALFVPANDIVKAIASAPDTVWSDWKGAWLRAMTPHPKIVSEFWKAVQQALNDQSLSAVEIEHLRARTFQDSEVAATFAGAASSLSPELLLQLIGVVSGTVWSLWREALLTTLQNDAATRNAFWNAARTVGLENSLLSQRLVEDAEFAATFGQLETDVLDFDDPALEPLLLRWLDAHLGSGELNGQDWANAAIHTLPGIRQWGLARLAEQGMNVPIALRLLESGLPDAVEAAKAWFVREDASRRASEGAAALDLALALCDSPHLPTREFGREFLAERLDFLLANGLMARLQENPNAEMQSFIAQLLLLRDTTSTPTDTLVDTTEFDRAVLRGRYRARKAKNLVQARRAQGVALPDEKTLLELARGRTPRDADWALTQLAKRALEGQVEGIEVTGTGGI